MVFVTTQISALHSIHSKMNKQEKNIKEKFMIRFAGITVRFQLPTEAVIPRELMEFICEDDNSPCDVEYQIQLLEEPLILTQQPIAVYAGIEVYQYKGKRLRVHTPLTEKDGCQVACLSKEGGKKYVLFYPAMRWKYYAQELHCLHLIGIEEVLLKYEALLLHSSFVGIHGQAVLFSGPSGIGKSTQAFLWEKYLGADILNGDRCIIRKRTDGFYGCGSPWCGTSGIYRKEQLPVRGIFLLRQSDENTVRRVGADGFRKIFQQCIVNAWDSEFVMQLTDLIIELMEQIPVYELACRPDEEAVHLAYETLFNKTVFK